MSKDINTTMENEKDAAANKPIELFIVELDEQTLCFCDYTENIDFYDKNGNQQTYEAVAISRGDVQTSIDTKVDEVQVSVDNVDLSMSAYEASSRINGRKMTIWKVFLDHLDDPDNYIFIFSGRMDAPAITQQKMSVNVVSELDTLDVQLPRRKFQTQCNWQFASEECGIDIDQYIQTGTVDSISSDGLTITDSDRTESDDYWKYGILTIGEEEQLVRSNSNGDIIVEFPFTNASAGDSYQIEPGCSKARDDNDNGCSRYNNTDRYGGFVSIPRIRDPRTEGY